MFIIVWVVGWFGYVVLCFFVILLVASVQTGFRFYCLMADFVFEV